MEKKPATIVHLVLFALAVFGSLLQGRVFALDVPHNGYDTRFYTVSCSRCHYDATASATPVWMSQPTDTDHTLINNLCTDCHSIGKLSTSRYSAVKTHSSANTSDKYGQWSVECRACHNPHIQEQVTNFSAMPEANVAMGTVTAVSSTAGYATSSLTVNAALAGNYANYILVPNLVYPTRMYRILSNTATEITVYGVINKNYAQAGRTFAVRYGKLVNDVIITPVGEQRVVRFFNYQGPNSFADADQTIDGVCQVCHDQTASFNRDGVLEGPGHPSSQAGGQCTVCHQHSQGFKPACGACHGNPPMNASQGGPDGLAVNDGGTGAVTPGAHEKHAIALGYECATCHSGGMPVSTIYDKKLQIGFSISNGAYESGAYDGRSSLANGYSYTAGNAGTTITTNGGKTCSNVYCHGSTMAPDGGTDITPVWDNPATAACGACHGATAANPPSRGSHYKHSRTDLLGYAYPCGTCHKDPSVDRSLHVNNQAEVLFSGPSSSGGSYNGSPAMLDAYGTCTNVYCHSTVQSSPPGNPPVYRTTPVWGGTIVSCGDCHDYAPNLATGSHGKHMQYGELQECWPCHNYSNTDDSCMACHDDATIEPRRDKHANHSIDVQFAPKYGGTYTGTPMPGDPYGGCANVYCHGASLAPDGGTNTAPQWGSAATGACGTCHGATAANPPTRGSHRMHTAASPSGYAFACGVCHKDPATDNSQHADKLSEVVFGGDPRTAAASYNGTNVLFDAYGSCMNTYCHSNGTSLATGSVPIGMTPVWGSGALACSSCHGYPPNYTNGSPKPNSHAAHGYTCDNCHSATTSSGSIITSPTKHANGAYDLAPGVGRSFSYSFAAPAGSCSTISCHGNTGTRWGSSACLDCHAVSQGGRGAIAPQFGGNSHHVQGVAVTGSHCYQCHWEANSDGSINALYHGGSAAPGSAVNLVVYQAGLRPAVYTPGTTAVPYVSNGSRSQIAAVTQHCLGCHSDQNNGARPFGDGRTPKQYAWDGTSVASRYTQTGTTAWGKYADYPNAAPKSLTKAFSAHGNLANNQRGWTLASGVDGTIINTGGNQSVQCFDCHNSHGSTVAGVTTRYATPTLNGGILKDTTAGLGGYAMSYQPRSGGSTSTKNARTAGASLCFDCHLTASAGTTPWGYLSTFGATTMVIGYWDSPTFAPGSAGAQLRYPYKNANQNAGGHFGASSPLSSAPMATIDGLCTPCHDPHGVSPTLGANQQYSVPLLKNTWLTSPYKEDVSPANNVPGTARGEGVQVHIDQNTFGSSISNGTTSVVTQTESQFAGLCLGCHPKSSLTTTATPSSPNAWKNKNRIHESVKGWKTSGATVQHSYVCSKCHSPHNGSVLPRLMVTNCMDGAHKGRSSFNVMAITSGSGSGQNVGYSTECYGLSTTLGACGSLGNYGGSGGGHLPGSWRGDAYGDFTVACHEGKTGSGTDQSWNVKTPWAINPPIAFTSGPSAGGFASAGGNVQAVITWSTNILTTSRVDYGLSTAYGSVATDSSPVVNNSVTLQNLTNHSTYHYKATSYSTGDSQQLSSADAAFYLSVAPPTPVQIALSSPIACASSCPVALQWNASTDPDGGPVQYRVQAGTDYWFNVVSYDSGWINGTSTVTSGLATNVYYYWRIQARDGNHTTALDSPSAWSPPQYFRLFDDRPVIYDWSITADGFASSGTDIMATVTWQTDKTSTSWVDYGTSPVTYSQTTGSTALVYLHSVELHNLTNHATTYYQVRSAGGSVGFEATSAQHSFSLNLPPTVPVLVAEPNASCAGSCPVTLQWNASTDPDGGAVQYDIQASTSPAFATIAYDSGWVSETSVTTSNLPTNAVYYWRVQARDTAWTTAVSSWSAAGSFTLENIPTITAGPAVGVFSATTGTDGTAAVTWTTDVPSSSSVDYGPTAGYGATATGTSGSTNHSVTIAGLTNHAGYHYRLRSTGSFSNEMISSDYTFTFAVPPTVPVPVHQTNSVCISNCTVTLQWSASTDPDGGPVLYNAQASSDGTFMTVGYSANGIATTGWEVSLPTGTTWYWRVQSYDGNHPETLSAWSSADSFKMLSAPPPPIPAVIPHGAYDSGCADTAVTVSWAPVASPDGHPVEYYVHTDSYGDSGWLPAGTTSWSFVNYAAWGVTWQVKARDAVHIDAESSYSAGDYFYDIGSACWAGSCPLVFAWDGAAFRYETDLQGPVIGLPPSNIKKETSLYQPVYTVLGSLASGQDGLLRVKIRESLSEITFLDEVKLLAVDHPAGYGIATSAAENTYNYGYVNPFTIYTFKDPVLPLSAFDRNGTDVLTQVLAVDNVPAPASINPSTPDTYVFDFGTIAHPEHAKLLIDGWSVYGVKKFKSTVTIQPSIEVKDQSGAWVKVRSFGTPVGDLKTMVVDLSNLFLSQDHRIRLSPGLRKGSRWVIDRIRLDDSAPVTVTVREGAPLSGDLQLAGMAIEQMSTMETRIIAHDLNLPLDPDALGYGRFTRYGDVLELLSSRDDKYAVMRHGDKIDLAFPSQDPPEEGMARDYVLKADLYYKTFGVTNVVEPMPFHAMSDYPYSAPEAYPGDADHQDYLTNYNTREFAP